MAFEAFTVQLLPNATSPLRSGCTRADVEKVADQVRLDWPAAEWVPHEFDAPTLVCRSAVGVIEVNPVLQPTQSNALHVFLRFAYANPHSVESVFFATIGHLMQAFDLYCSVLETMTPDFPTDLSREMNTICDPAHLCHALSPAITYNRQVYHADWGTHPLASLRPSEAVVRFIEPQLRRMSRVKMSEDRAGMIPKSPQ